MGDFTGITAALVVLGSIWMLGQAIKFGDGGLVLNSVTGLLAGILLAFLSPKDG